MSHAIELKQNDDRPSTNVGRSANLIRFGAPIAIFLIGIFIYYWISPGSLDRKVFFVNGTKYSVRLYTRDKHRYAQCSTSAGSSSTMCVASEMPSSISDAKILFQEAEQVIVFLINGHTVGSYQIQNNSLAPNATAQKRMAE